MKHKFPVALFLILILFACKNSNERHTSADSPKASMPAATTKKDYSTVEFALKKDPACGMPLSNGVQDTAHYEGKIYGFCSEECKDDFLRNPASFLHSNIEVQ